MADSTYATFLSLPVELRIYIYEYYFMSTAPKLSQEGSLIRNRPYEHALLDLFLTCRQVYEESHKIAYMTNTFVIQRRYFLEGAVADLGKHAPCNLITSVLFPTYHRLNPDTKKGSTRSFFQHTLFSFVRHFPALDTIYVLAEINAQAEDSILVRLMTSLVAQSNYRRSRQDLRSKITTGMRIISTKDHKYELRARFPRHGESGEEPVWRRATLVLCRIWNNGANRSTGTNDRETSGTEYNS